MAEQFFKMIPGKWKGRSASERDILTVIDQLSPCNACNERLSYYTDVSERQIRRDLKKLEEEGIIEISRIGSLNNPKPKRVIRIAIKPDKMTE